MILYTNDKGKWVGTQREAKKEFGRGNFSQVEVPTDKDGLIKFLSFYQVGDTTPFERTPERADSHPLSCTPNPTKYDVKDAVLNCDKQHLGQALAAVITRLYDIEETVS